MPGEPAAALEINPSMTKSICRSSALGVSQTLCQIPTTPHPDAPKMAGNDDCCGTHQATTRQGASDFCFCLPSEIGDTHPCCGSSTAPSASYGGSTRY